MSGAPATQADNAAGDCRAALARVCDFYADLTPAALAKMPDIYAPDVLFSDPAGEVRGRDALRAHFAALLQNAHTCRFAFRQTLAQGDNAALFWRMTFAAPRINGGREYAVDGASRLLFAGGLVARHADYFDLGALLYERLPLLGALVRRLRRRLAAGA